MDVLIVDEDENDRKNLKKILTDMLHCVNIKETSDANSALSICKERYFDIAYIDIGMSNADGPRFIEELKELRPVTNIVIVTDTDKYAMDGHRLFVSGYLIKPVTGEDIASVFGNLRIPVREDVGGMRIRCFGNFEVFYDGRPVKFLRGLSKELFAYLIDRRGAVSTNVELRKVLWEDEFDETSDKQRKYFAKITGDLRKTLEGIGCEDIFIQRHNAYSVRADKIICDYYLALRKDPQAMVRFTGEYMSQYSWGKKRVDEIREEIR